MPGPLYSVSLSQRVSVWAWLTPWYAEVVRLAARDGERRKQEHMDAVDQAEEYYKTLRRTAVMTAKCLCVAACIAV